MVKEEAKRYWTYLTLFHRGRITLDMFVFRFRDETNAAVRIRIERIIHANKGKSLRDT